MDREAFRPRNLGPWVFRPEIFRPAIFRPRIFRPRILHREILDRKCNRPLLQVNIRESNRSLKPNEEFSLRLRRRYFPHWTTKSLHSWWVPRWDWITAYDWTWCVWSVLFEHGGRLQRVAWCYTRHIYNDTIGWWTTHNSVQIINCSFWLWYVFVVDLDFGWHVDNILESKGYPHHSAHLNNYLVS